MKLSRIHAPEVLGALASLLLVVSLIGFEWYSLTDVAERQDEGQFLCGIGQFSCTGWETFPILRWLLILGASAPLILGYIIGRGHELSWPPGELTMVVGATATVLIFYNGVIDRPGDEPFGISLSYGYWAALLAAVLIGVAGAWRMIKEGGGAPRRPPGTFSS